MRDNYVGVFLMAVLVLVFASAILTAQGGEKININLADSATLQELPGIGPAMAGRIIEYREENGPFARIEDLMEVRGIGEKRFLNLQELITVTAPEVPGERNDGGSDG